MVHIPTSLLAKVAPRHAEFIVNDLQYVNIFNTAAAHRDLDFRYSIPIVEGVRRITAWLDAHDGIANSDADPFDDRVNAAWESLSAQFASRSRQWGTDVARGVPWAYCWHVCRRRFARLSSDG
jgi:hypothetical protein